ncbi:hypothetical protein PR202_ga26109 [Eleusine coracana subsp. coracana]|uniref:Arogenate dehydratase n=1 Tax=Eleusine coracana subsp. coracana TaxID=191504 RepID=A0AAV5DDD9_ELECO|nr:hypothetical protein PR202_ga26109 [Eleusine coracana subsp. coracana]
MASTACLRLPFLTARTGYTTSSSPRHASLKCSDSNAKASNSVYISQAASPLRGAVTDGVESVDLNGLRRPPAPLPGSTVPAVRDPRWLPRTSRPLTSADLMEAGCEGLKVAYQAVQDRLAHRAVLPLENSLGGSIHRNYDLLLRHKLHIVGEVRLAVRHCLLANPGVKIENLTSAMSHPQALAQCEHTLTELGIEHREAVDDTAGAAKFVAEQRLQNTGAIASSLAAELYGLDILAENIQDDKDNVTRFMMLAPDPIIARTDKPFKDDKDNVTRFMMLAPDPIIARTDKPFKTSIVFSLQEGPGELFKALAVFALREINLTKIESRPHKNRPLRVANDCSSPLKHFDYLFYVDLEASTADPRTQNALGNLKVHFLFTLVRSGHVNKAHVALFAGVCNLFTGLGKLSNRYK